MQGRAFGLQRAMDFAGATAGVLVLYFLCLKFIDHASGTIKNMANFYTLFVVSIVPAAIGVVFCSSSKSRSRRRQQRPENRGPDPTSISGATTGTSRYFFWPRQYLL